MPAALDLPDLDTVFQLESFRFLDIKTYLKHIMTHLSELDGKVKIVKLNVDDFPLVGARYGVRGLPTMLLFKQGKVAATHNGAMNRQALANWISQSL